MFDPTDFFKNVMSYFSPENEKKIESEIVYFCRECGGYFKDGIEISKWDAQHNFDIEKKICNNCLEYNKLN